MKVYSALMLDENEVADHNSPTLLVAASEAILVNLVRDHVKSHTHWLDAVNVNKAEIDTMSIDEMNAKLSGEGADGEDEEDWEGTDGTLFIHTDEHEV